MPDIEDDPGSDLIVVLYPGPTSNVRRDGPRGGENIDEAGFRDIEGVLECVGLCPEVLEDWADLRFCISERRFWIVDK